MCSHTWSKQYLYL